jgi:hypothetical protein
MIDMDGNLPFDYIIGVPSGDPLTGPKLGCPLFDTSCFGLYIYDNMPSAAPGFRFKSKLLPEMYTDNSRNPTSNSAPDLEWTIRKFSSLKPFPDPDRLNPFSIYAQAFAGSLVDAGIGEDFLPTSTSPTRIEFPCNRFDVCGICNGDGVSCLDCKGDPHGDAEYDRCDVCDGDGDSCLDCARVPFGNARYDVCDVCKGDGDSCLDCKGIPFGDAEYDICDICEGDGTSCLDCEWCLFCCPPPGTIPFANNNKREQETFRVEADVPAKTLLFRELDVDGNGLIDRKEFKKFVKLDK